MCSSDLPTDAAPATRRRSEETRELIVAAATECLRHRRVRDLRVEEVMEAAGPGLSRTLFYRHFDDLVALVVDIASPAFDQLFGEDNVVKSSARTLDEALRASFGVIVSVFVQHGPMIRAAVDAATFSDVAERAVRSYFEKGFDLAARVLRDLGVSEPEETGRALVHMDVAYLIDTFGGEPRIPAEMAVDTLARIWGARCSVLATGD